MTEEELKNFIEDFVKKMGVTVEVVEVVSIASHKMFNIKTPDSKQLIGPHGDHLRSLNYILRRTFEKKNDKDEIKCMIDVNGYQQKHIQNLEQKAKLLADRVRTFKSSADMTPMTAYERMIIHSIFSEDSEITTKSEGFGPNRHVVLSYKSPTA